MFNMKRYLLVFGLIYVFSINLMASQVKLTNDEKKYLEDTIFQVSTTASWAPFNFYNNQKKLTGIGIDYWKLIAKKLDLKSKINIQTSFQNVLNSIKSKKLDMTLTTSATKDRERYSIFSKRYDSFPIAIATTKDEKFIAKVSFLEGRKVAVGKEYSAYYLLKAKYKDINFVLVENTKEALNLVEEKKVFAAIDILPALQYNVNNHNSNDLKIAGTTDINFDLQIMVRDDYKPLMAILNKAIDSITQQERNEIYKKWLFQSTVAVYDYSLFYKVVSALIFIILLIGYWYRKLSKEKKKLDYILSNLPVPVLITDNKTRKILFANPYASELYKFEIDELVGQSIDVIYTDHTNQRENILNAINNEGVLQDFDNQYKLKDGEVIDGLLSIIPIEYNKQSARVGIIANITELKKTQQELLELNDKLENKIKIQVEKNRHKDKLMFQQNRLAQMGEMISMIAHQWRQPLNNLFMLNQSISLKYKMKKLDDDIMEYFKENSKKQITQMSKTIDDFRDFFKPEKEKVEFVINDVIKDTIDIIKPVIDKNSIEFVFDCDDDIIAIGYPNEFGQVIINIINNAKDVLIAKDIKDKKITISCTKNNNHIDIKISDNAGGIPEDIMDNIFDPYFSTKEEKNGTGLGLYMTKIIIEDHMHGKLSVSNNKDGAVFKIELGDNNG